MPLRLSLRQPTTIPVEVFGVRPDAVRLLSSAEIERLPVLWGRHTVPLAEVFTADGSAASDETMVWSGDLRAVKGLGAEQTTGITRIEGAAGLHVGAAMRGGLIEVTGSVGDWAGAELRGGQLRIHGSAGRCVGGAYRGGLRGMTGGEIIIHGDCGEEAGQAMRRGLLAVGGAVGAGVGFGMLAGTIAVAGEIGRMPMAGMKRGTLLALSTAIPLLPSFRESSHGEFVAARLIIRRLVALGLPRFTRLIGQPLRRYWGDFNELGRGEIFCPLGNV